MKNLLLCKTKAEWILPAKEILEQSGQICCVYRYSSADKLRETIRKEQPDFILSGECMLLRHVPQEIPSAYLASDFFCPEKVIESYCRTVLIPHEELAFAFISKGARDRSVSVCGIPLPQVLRTPLKRERCHELLGMESTRPTFLLLTDGVNMGEIKSTVRSIFGLNAQAQAVLLSGDPSRRKTMSTAFSAFSRAFILPEQENLTIGLSAADIVCTPAFAMPVAAAARMEKITVLLHTPLSRARQNASFLDSRGIAFSGKTAADNVSYALRLLESFRLRSIMTQAQQRYIYPDAEDRLITIIEKIKKSD